MNDDEHDLTEDDALDRIVRDYYEAAERGETLNEDYLVEQHPEFERELRSFFASVRQVHGVPQRDVAPSTHESFSVGANLRYFGDYEILQEISRGGMGVVFKARQVNLDRIVALKMILAGQLASQKDVDRFHAEAEAAAQLDHPGIVSIYEIGQYDGRHYFSMAYVDGRNLAAEVADVDGRLPPREAARRMLGICEAIAYAHDNGVIHRDLKPANVLVDSHGNTRVTDFGLAKRLEIESELTQSGQILGTPSYMPPEQAAGRVSEVGMLSDVYSLGGILYFLLTARPPFQSSNTVDTLQQVIQQEPVQPRLLDASVPSDLETICLKCLRKRPDERYRSVRELADDISRFLRGEPIHARPLGMSARLLKWYLRNVQFVAPVAITATYAITTLMDIGGPVVRIVRNVIDAKFSVSYLDEGYLIVVFLFSFALIAFTSRAAWNGKLYGVALNTLAAIFFVATSIGLLWLATGRLASWNLDIEIRVGMLLWSLVLVTVQIHSLILSFIRRRSTVVETGPQNDRAGRRVGFKGIGARLRSQVRLGLSDPITLVVIGLSALVFTAAIVRRVMRESYGISASAEADVVTVLAVAVVLAVAYLVRSIVRRRNRS